MRGIGKLITAPAPSCWSVWRPRTIHITDITVSGGTVTILFTAGVSDTPGSFVLEGAPSVNGTYVNLEANITSLGSGNFQATIATSGPSHFYRIRR